MNFLSKIFSRKKLIIFAFLFVIAVSIPIATTMAQFGGAGVNPAGGMGNPLTAEEQAEADAADDEAADAAWDAEAPCMPSKTQWCCYRPGADWENDSGTGGNVCITEQPATYLGGNGASWASKIAIALGELVIWGTFRIAGYSSYVLSYVFFAIVSKAVTTDPNFIPAWEQVRNLANMLIVLGFVIVGIATALRIQAWAAKQLLWKLILVALVVNFSGLFCGLIIDASNLTTRGLLGGENAQSNTNTIQNTGETVLFRILTGIKGKPGGVLSEPYAAAHAGAFAGYCILAGFVYLGVAFTFLYMSVILIARYVILIMLFILSPLAFVFLVFPSTKDKWTKWWNTFIKWCFVGVFGSFVLLLATIQANVLSKTMSNGSTTDVIISAVIILGFLFIGFKMTAGQTGIASMASTAIMGIAGGAVKLGMGAIGAGAMGGAKILDKISGGRGSAAVQKLKSGYGKGLEKIGLRKEFSTESANAGQVDAASKDMSKAYGAAKATGDTATMGKIRGYARDGKGVRGGAAMKVISDAKDFGDTFNGVSPDKAAQRIKYAESVGASGIREQVEKRDPHMRAYNKIAIAKKMRENPTFSESTATSEVVADGFKNAGVADIREFSSDALKSREFAMHTPIGKMRKAADMMSEGKVNNMRTGADELLKEHNRIDANRSKMTGPMTQEFEDMTNKMDGLKKKFDDMSVL